MNSKTINEVLDRLVGNTDSIGESNYDEVSYNNLLNLEDTLYHIVNKYVDNFSDATRREYSMEKIGRKSIIVITDLLLYLNDYLNELDLELGD